MAVRLLASRTGRPLLSRNVFNFCLWYSFMFEADKTPEPSAAGRIKHIDKNLEPAIFWPLATACPVNCSRKTQYKYNGGFEVYTTVAMSNVVFWYAAPCRFCEI
jgi:hypothetical protein